VKSRPEIEFSGWHGRCAAALLKRDFATLQLNLKEKANVKQYQGTSDRDRDPQGVTSAQPPASSSQKEASARKSEEQKKVKTGKAGEHREKR
jgi:hypothetical protein